MRGKSHKDVAEEMRVLKRLGFESLGQDGTEHHRFGHPEYGQISLPGSPSNPRWRPAFRQRLAGLMGMSKPDLERRLGERPPKASGKRTSKPAGERPEQVVKRHAARLGIPCTDDFANWALRKFGTPKAARQAFRRMLVIEGDTPQPKQSPSADPITTARRQTWEAQANEATKARLGKDTA